MVELYFYNLIKSHELFVHDHKHHSFTHYTVAIVEQWMHTMQNLIQEEPQNSTLRQIVLDNIFQDFNSPGRLWIRKMLEPWVWLSIHRFVNLASTFDRMVGGVGFQKAVDHILAPFVEGVDSSGVENVPVEGPLLIVSNHPGTYDSLVIASNLPRDDLNIIATNFPILKNLPVTSKRLIFVDPHAGMNLSVFRSSIRHLRAGGSVLIFPSGRIEPDPAIFPSAVDALVKWSPSIELLLEKVPQTKVLVSIVSGVLSPMFLKNPLMNLWKGMRDPLAISEVTQIAFQVLFTKWFQTKPKITFNFPITVDELLSRNERVYQTVLAEASCLMQDHLPVRNL